MTNSLLSRFVPSSVTARLGLCAAAAVVSSAAIVTDAQAVVVTFNTPLSVPNDFDGIYLNLLNGTNGTAGGSVAGWDINLYNSGTTLSFFWNQAVANSSGGVASTTTGPYSDLAAGSTISSASTFALVTAGTATSAFQTVGTHTLGFRFWNEGTSAINYGYMTLQVGGTTGFPLTITRWAFENSGAAISIPAAVVPEPASAAMLAMGALALGGLQLRRARRHRLG